MVQVPRFRLNLLRAYYLLIAIERAWRVLPRWLVGEPLGPFDGTAYAFWTALALLALLGLRYPLQMLPLLFVHLTYKTVWIAGVAVPMWLTGAEFDPVMTAFAWAMVVGVLLDLVIIPWKFVWVEYLRRSPERHRAPGDRATA